jgi:hypothetical protein
MAFGSIGYGVLVLGLALGPPTRTSSFNMSLASPGRPITSVTILCTLLCVHRLRKAMLIFLLSLKVAVLWSPNFGPCISSGGVLVLTSLVVDAMVSTALEELPRIKFMNMAGGGVAAPLRLLMFCTVSGLIWNGSNSLFFLCDFFVFFLKVFFSFFYFICVKWLGGERVVG